MFNQNITLVGLNSIDTAVPVTGPYFVSGKLSLPRLAAGGGQSAVIVTITNRTGPVTLYTGPAGADGFYVDAGCVAGDILRVALTSSASADTSDINAVKAQIEIGSGQ